MIKTVDLNKNFGDLKILKNINLEVPRGETAVVIGTSGCGKSTLLKCLNGLEKVTSGQIFIDDQEITAKKTDLNKIRSKIGIVFQNFNLFPHMTILENITFAPLKVKNMDKGEVHKKSMLLLEKFKLLDKMDKYPSQISGGQAQRVSIIRSLMMDPDVMLFDEPTSALDPKMTAEIISTIKSLKKEGMTMLVVTHEMSLAKSIGDKIHFLSNGVVLESNTTEEFFNNPQNPITKEFLNNIESISS